MPTQIIHPSLGILLACAVLTPSIAHAQSASQVKIIEGALLSIPGPMRDQATVILDAPNAKRIVLRTGSNNLICRANTLTSGFNTYCYPKAMDAFWSRYEQLGHDGKSNTEIRDTLGADARAGTLQPMAGATTYTMSGDSQDSSLPLMAVFLPNATAETTGLSIQRDHYRPWLMWAGTPFAHIMIPGQ